MKHYYYQIGTGWTGTFQIDAISEQTAIRRIAREWGIDKALIRIWEK